MKKNQDIKNILVITYWDFNDALIQTYTLPYVKLISDNLPKGSTIYLFTINKNNAFTPPDLSEWNIKLISSTYSPFGFKGMLMWLKTILFLVRIIISKKISMIHSWCTPAGGLGYVLSIITRKKLVLDSFEPHAESMVENGTWLKNSRAFKILFRLERLQLKRAQHVIAAADGMKDYCELKYNYIPKNFYTKPACVDLELFSDKNKKNKVLLEKLGLSDKIVCVYAGKFGGIYLDKEVFDLFKVAQDYYGEKFHALVLSNQDEESIIKLANSSDFHLSALTLKFVAHSEIPNYIGLADFAITPVKPVATKKYCTPIKDGEYWALGLPVIITSDISDDSRIIHENEIGSVLNELNYEAYLVSIKEIDTILKKNTSSEIYSKIRLVAERKRNFSIANTIYKAIYNPSSK